MRKKTTLLLLLLLSSSFLFSQVRFFTNFDTGSIGDYQLIDSSWIKRGANDSLLTLSYQINSRFDPLNPVDTALRPSARWYHFAMSGVKGKQLFLTINNSEVIRPFYSYDGITYNRFEFSENLFKGTINTIPTRDTLYIAHFIPYSYNRLLTKMAEWQKSPYTEIETIGFSSQNLPLEMVTITDHSVDNRDKKRVWIHGRAHPSEAPSSWHLEGVIEELLSDSPFARELRRETLFFIVPIINPDGVKGGYSRSTSTGVNIEINWDREPSQTMPEIKALKTALERVTTKWGPLDLALNMHSQISSSITYWIHTAKSTSDLILREQQLLSALTINYSPYFRAEDQLFSDIAPRYFEGWLWDRFKERTLSITFETPYTYYNQDREGDWVSIENLYQLSLSTLYSVSDLLDLGGEERFLIDIEEARAPRGWERVIDQKQIFFGHSFLKAKRAGAKLRYSLPTLPKGVYRVYRWQVGPTAERFPEEVNCWMEVDRVEQRRDGRFKYQIESKNSEEMVDALLLIKENL